MTQMLNIHEVVSGNWAKPISLNVEKGDLVIIVGRNGVGKTTLLNTIAGLIPIRSGRVMVRNHDVTRFNELGRTECGIRIALEGRQNFGRLSVEKNLRLGSFNIKDTSNRIDLRLEWVLEIFPDLREKLYEKASSLSGGQQTQLSIGRALMGFPQVLLLDEPSLGLDPRSTKNLLRALKHVQTQEEVTLVIAEQNGLFLRELQGQVIVMVGGEITFNGKLEDAIDTEALSPVIPSLGA